MIHALRFSRHLAQKLAYRFSASLVQKQWGLTDDYEILSPLGKGSSARVFMGVNVLTSQRVVIKVFKQFPPEYIRKQISINLQLLSQLKKDHKNVEFIKLLDVCYDETSKTYTFIYQYFDGVPLNQLIQMVSLNQAKRHVLILAHTLKYIHSLGIIHRDMKPANILITPSGPKLFDFGLSKRQQELNGRKTNNFGTKCYKTPEVVLRMATYDQSVDIWGLGLIFAELALKKKHLLPYDNDRSMLSQVCSFCSFKQNDNFLVKRQLSEHIFIDRNRSWESLASKKKIQPDLIELISRMLEINPSKRPSLQDIINHSTFRELSLV